MKLKMFLAVIMGIMLSVSAYAQDHSDHSAHNSHGGHNGHGTHFLDLMHAPMMAQSISKTGNVDIDYLTDMIPHHQGAIDSSVAYLKVAKNSRLKKLANEIIKSQTAEIKLFHKLLKDGLNETQLAKKEYNKYYKQAVKDMDVMMAEMGKVKPSGNDDKDFAQSMMAHHQGAIDSSKNLLKYTKDPRMKKVAEDIIKAQEKEIQEMKDVLSKLK